MLVSKALTSIALAISLSSNVIVAPPSNVDCKEDTAPSTSTTWVSSSSSTPSSLGAAAIIPLPFRTYDTANDIPAQYYKDNKVIHGRVVKITDGDTLRIRHTPLYPISKGEKGCVNKKLTECTISVRLYGVDAPETAKFGNEGQPYAKEAKEYISSIIASNKIVTVKLLRKDQYSRVIGSVTTRSYKYLPFIQTDLSKGLAENGYASLYTGRGAEYNDNLLKLEKKIEKAQKQKKGIWSNGVGEFQDPASYKRQIKARKNNGNGK